jgi:hypothetical protein
VSDGELSLETLAVIYKCLDIEGVGGRGGGGVGGKGGSGGRGEK